MTKIFFQRLVCIIVLFASQSSFLPILQYEGIGPDLLLLVVGSYSFLFGSRKGSFNGFLVGLFQDLASGTFFGINTLTKTLVGYACGILSSRVLQDGFFVPISIAVFTTVGSYVAVELIMLMLGYSFNPALHLTSHLVPMLCYNIVFAYPIHRLVHRFVDEQEDQKTL